MKQFTAKIRDNGTGSLELTVPSTIVEALGLKDGDICDLTIAKDEEAMAILEAKPTEK